MLRRSWIGFPAPPLVKHFWLAGALFAWSSMLWGQSPPATPAPAFEPRNPATQIPTELAVPPKPPEELFKDAMHPLDAVRGSLDNWSDAELGALAAGMHMAAQDCAQTRPELYQGNDLYALARLCAFGQDWDGANAAALAYVARHEDEHLAQAYSISVSALVHMGATDLAVQTADEMLNRLPYDAEVAYALRDLKNDLVQASNPSAFPLAEAEHPLIVAALKQGVALKATHGDAVVGLGVLYESAMQLAFLDRFSGHDAAAATAAADVQAALPPSVLLGADDRQRREAIDIRYRLLGMHLPAVKVVRALQSPAAKAQIDLSFASASVLVLFPDWCVACRKMMKPLTEFAVLNRDTPIHAYGLVFADDSVVSGKAAHDENFKQLAGTQTLEVDDAAAQAFGATDYPLGIVLDNTRTIRFIGLLPSNAFNGDGYISKVIVNMTKAASGTRERTQN